MKTYHFRPAKLGIVAVYYPATILGWAITIILGAAFIFYLERADQNSHSARDMLINFAPFAVAILLIFDSLCFRMGEYPSWWKKWHHNNQNNK